MMNSCKPIMRFYHLSPEYIYDLSQIYLNSLSKSKTTTYLLSSRFFKIPITTGVGT